MRTLLNTAHRITDFQIWIEVRLCDIDSAQWTRAVRNGKYDSSGALVLWRLVRKLSRGDFSTSTVKKSVAARASQWDFKNVFQGVLPPRSGAGTMPASFRMRLMVDGGAAEFMPEVPQDTANPRVAPGGVIVGHRDDQLFDILRGARPPRPAPTGAVVFLGDELAVPTQDGVRRDDSGDLAEELSAEELALRRQPAALVVGEPKTASTELLTEDAVFLEHVLDDLLLPAVRGDISFDAARSRRHPCDEDRPVAMTWAAGCRTDIWFGDSTQDQTPGQWHTGLMLSLNKGSLGVHGVQPHEKRQELL